MNLIRRHKVIVSIVATVIVMDVLSSIIYAAGTFPGSCPKIVGGLSPLETYFYPCHFTQYYFSVNNLAGNPFIDPLNLIGRLIKLFNPTSSPSS